MYQWLCWKLAKLSRKLALALKQWPALKCLTTNRIWIVYSVSSISWIAIILLLLVVWLLLLLLLLLPGTYVSSNPHFFLYETNTLFTKTFRFKHHSYAIPTFVLSYSLQMMPEWLFPSEEPARCRRGRACWNITINDSESSEMTQCKDNSTYLWLCQPHASPISKSPLKWSHPFFHFVSSQIQTALRRLIFAGASPEV